MSLIKADNNKTSIGSDSIAYITIYGDDYTATTASWERFPCVINQKLDLEPKTGQLEDDRGRVVYSYSQPSKVKYSAAIFQRDAKTFEFFRENSGQTFLMWIVVGQIGENNQEILMYGKFGGNYSEDMKADPNIPFEFNCEVNKDTIIANKPGTECWADKITLPAGKMMVKNDCSEGIE
jgi:hypothetical protein